MESAKSNQSMHVAGHCVSMAIAVVGGVGVGVSVYIVVMRVLYGLDWGWDGDRRGLDSVLWVGGGGLEQAVGSTLGGCIWGMDVSWGVGRVLLGLA